MKILKEIMEKSKTTSIVETKSNDAISGYFERAGSFGAVAIMAVFYTALFAIISLS
jgi:hypothetical protein